MGKYNLICLIALLIIVTALPVYALLEPTRMDQARVELRRELVMDAADTYLDACASCHGTAGEGIGAMPALNRPGLAEADNGLLYGTIAHSPHGTKMAAWHIEEGGILNDYEVESLVTLITQANWPQVSELAAARKLVLPATPVPMVDMTALEGGAEEDPHECVACHEEPTVHIGQFGLNCARCHTLQAWTPARLVRHVFLLDHGGEGAVACETCHTVTYSEHTCYECHDHEPEQMREKHVEEDVFELENCVGCHPTGREGEAERLRDAYWGLEDAVDRFLGNDGAGQELVGERVGYNNAGQELLQLRIVDGN